MESVILAIEALKLPAWERTQIIDAFWRSLDPAEQFSIDHWVSERLGMGHCTWATQAISRMSRRPDRELDKIKRQLVANETAPQPNACE